MADTPNIAVIGGSGLRDIPGAKQVQVIGNFPTPYGNPSSPLYWMKYEDLSKETPEFLFLLRHGVGHTIPPHQINERANIFALMNQKVDIILNFTAVGAISNIPTKFKAGDFAIITKVLDQTGPRTGKTFFQDGWVGHCPTEKISCPYVQNVFVEACEELGFRYHLDKSCVTIEGPHYYNEAELRMTGGCDLIGMTQIPFTKLAVESNTCILVIAIVTDDVTENNIVTADLVEKRMKENKARLAKLLKHMIGSVRMTVHARDAKKTCINCVHKPNSIITDMQYWTDDHKKLFKLMFRRWKNQQK